MGWFSNRKSKPLAASVRQPERLATRIKPRLVVSTAELIAAERAIPQPAVPIGTIICNESLSPLEGALHFGVDLLHPTMVAGWAVDVLASGKPVFVCVTINGDPIAEGYANEWRADLERFQKGLVGFRVCLPRHIEPGDSVRIEFHSRGQSFVAFDSLFA